MTTQRERLAEARALLKRHMAMQLLLLDRVQKGPKGLPYIRLFRDLQDDSRAWLAHDDEERDDD